MAPVSTSDPASPKRRVGSTFDLTADTDDTVIPFFAHWGARLVAAAADAAQDVAGELAEAENARTSDGILVPTQARFWRAVVNGSAG